MGYGGCAVCVKGWRGYTHTTAGDAEYARKTSNSKLLLRLHMKSGFRSISPRSALNEYGDGWKYQQTSGHKPTWPWN